MPLAGTVAPGRPSTPTSPARALGAPQTTCSGSPSPVSTDEHLQLVGIGMARGAQHAGDPEPGQALGRVFDPLDFKPDGVELGGDRLDARLGIEVVLEPGQRELHAAAPTPPESVGTSSGEKP